MESIRLRVVILPGDWIGEIIPSKHNYADFQKTESLQLQLDELPNFYGTTSTRRESIQDQHVIYNSESLPNSISVSGSSHVLWNGLNHENLVTTTRHPERKKTKQLRHETPGEPVKLHPVEVVLSPLAVDQMRKASMKVCGNLSETRIENLLETGGYLGGDIKRDAQGRWYTVIEYAYADSQLKGTESSFTFDIELKRKMENSLASLDLHNVGFWHSHPTYGPFQSDARLQSYGADVQATHGLCVSWWSTALVIDPFSGHDKTQVSIGCYKINGIHDSFGPNGSKDVGWRSTGFGVRKIRNIAELLRLEKEPTIQGWQRESIEFEIQMLRSAVSFVIGGVQENEAIESRIVRILNSDEFPLITGVEFSDAKILLELITPELPTDTELEMQDSKLDGKKIEKSTSMNTDVAEPNGPNGTTTDENIQENAQVEMGPNNESTSFEVGPEEEE